MTIGLEKIYKSSLIHILEECSKELEDLNLLKIKGTRKLYNDNNLTNDQITFQEETLNQYIVVKQKEALEGGIGGFKDELIRVDVHKNIKNSIDYDHIISSLHRKDIIIQNSFYHLNNRYKYFSDYIEYCVRDYIKVFKTLKLVNFLSEQKQVDDIILSQNSYKVMILFFAAQKNSDSLRRFNNYLKTNPILKEDLNQSLDKISYPENGQKISLFKWQKLIREKGITAMKIFSKADTIEDTIKKKKLEESINVTSFDKLKEIYSSIIFHRADEFPELAKLIIKYPIDDKAFNVCLEIHKSKKLEEKLPDITINGRDIGCSGYYLTKLQVKHPHFYILGYVLHCCLKPSNDNGLPFIKYAATLKTHGIYVLLKSKSKETIDNLLFTNQEEKIDYNKFNIVGAVYCWISQSGNLVIDSWDNLWSGNRGKYDSIIALHFCKRLFSELGKYDIHRVTMGIGGYCEYLYETLNKRCNFTEYPELMLEGECSGKSYDSIYQNVIYESDDLIKERQNLCKKYNFLDPESLISLDQMKLIPQILELYDEEVWSIITKPSALYVHSFLGVKIIDKINYI
ncbi:hypothetical protein OAP56_01350, partial [Rickettsiaceae bacterium]|nr:hypothetical protein [Rickettsiaceae bacterium]